MDFLLLAGRLFLAAVFLAAGCAKLADRAGSRKSAADFGVPPRLVPILAHLLPFMELVCAAALIPVATAWWGAAGVLGLLSVFIAAIALNLAQGKRPDCHCFGQLHSTPIGWSTLARNVVLSAVAIFILWQGRAHRGIGLAAWLTGMDRLQASLFAFGAIGAAVLVVVFWLLWQLLQQNGRLLVRLETIEAKLGIDPHAPPPPSGLPVQSPAPSFSLPALNGGTVALDDLTQAALPVLLLFTEPGCSACEPLLPEIAQWQQEHAGRLEIALISRGTPAENREKTDKHHVQNILLETGREVSQAYRAEATPAGVLIISGRIASALALGADAIRALVARAVLPRVTRGDTVPTLVLPALKGGTIDLGRLRGHRSLLLFWSPSCAYCQRMLPDIKKWEQMPLNGGLRLYVVSSGSAEENRQQGFRSPVLLDAAAAAMHVFGTVGTPSAVMLDEQGKVASGVEVGADAVLALAGVLRVAVR